MSAMIVVLYTRKPYPGVVWNVWVRLEERHEHPNECEQPYLDPENITFGLIFWPERDSHERPDVSVRVYGQDCESDQ